MIDTHTHLDFKEFNNDREEVIKRYFDGGGEKLINVGCNLESSQESCKLAKKYENIFASVGVHPHDADTINEQSIKKLEGLAEHYKIIAIGEIGLDYFRNLSPQEKQTEAFQLQLELAENHKKPVIIHCRDAYNDLLDILKSYKTSNWRGVVHCFSASWKIAEEFLKLGLYIGFTGIVTYYKDKSEFNGEPEIYKVIRNVPLNKILIETDCPYLSPIPHREERNEPLYVKYVAKKIAAIKKIEAEEAEKVTSKNVNELFRI